MREERQAKGRLWLWWRPLFWETEVPVKAYVVGVPDQFLSFMALLVVAAAGWELPSSLLGETALQKSCLVDYVTLSYI